MKSFIHILANVENMLEPVPAIAAVAPASTGRTTPVIHLACSLAKNRTAAPQSHPLPSVFNMLRCRRASRTSGGIPLLYNIGVYSRPIARII